MSILATLNDTHFGVKGDAEYMLDYQEKFYKEFFFPTLLKNDVKTILHGGDLMDRRKYVNFNTLNRMKKMLFDPAREYGIEIFIIPGNHDVALKNTNELNSLDELLGGYSNVHAVQDPTILEFGDTKILMLPWLNGENYKSSMEFVSDNNADILYGHLELVNFEMYRGVTNDHGMDPIVFKKFDQVLSGHFHTQSQKDNIHYLGSPMEFTWADHDDPRGFHLIDTETKKLTFHQNKCTLYEKIYYSDETAEDQKKFTIMNVAKYTNKIVKLFVAKKTNPALFESFVDRLYKQNLIDLTIMEDHSEFHEANIELDIADNSTKDLMDKYVDAATTEMDKPRLKGILSNLYIEALHTE